MTCPPHDQLSACADQQLPPAELARLRRHLQKCPACQAQLQAITALGHSLRALTSPALGYDLAGQWEERLRSAPQPLRRPARPWADWRGWMPAGLGAGLALASGVWVGGVLLGGGMASAPAANANLVRVFDPVPPGGLCAAAEICRLSPGMR